MTGPTPLDAPPPLDALIDHLLSQGTLSPPALDRGRRAASEGGGRLDQVLNRLGLVTDEALLDGWRMVTGYEVIDTAGLPPEPPLLDRLPLAFLRDARCLPVRADDAQLVLAIEDPLDDFVPAAVAARTGLRVIPQLIRRTDLEPALDRLALDRLDSTEAGETATAEAFGEDLDRLRDLASDAPVIRFVHQIVDRAVELRASDIHLTTGPNGSRLRFRVDGLLREGLVPAGLPHAAIISRLKILAGLDIAERRLPQDGRIRLGVRGREIDLRLATMPHIHGEGAVLRLLDRSATAPDLQALGLSLAVLEPLMQALAAPHGLILVSGPTGSGKTTTLYAALRALAGPERNIITVEDPIEVHLDGANQIQVAPRIGLDFARALRAVLRQDPDVIMVGEIRDTETAAIATQAALTGHLVLATLHTNTAAGAVPRLIDMGVEPFLLASTVRGVLAQRLVRRLCPACRQPDGAGGFAAAGCPACDGTGHIGRLAIAEFIPVSDAVRDAIGRAANEAEIERIVRREGRPDLRADGRNRVRDGSTSQAELSRVLGPPPGEVV